MAGGNSGSSAQGRSDVDKMCDFLNSSNREDGRNKAQQLVNLLLEKEFSGIDNFVHSLPEALKQDHSFREKLAPVLQAAANQNIPKHRLGRFFRYACLSCVEPTDPIYTAKYDQCVKFFELFRALGELVDQDPNKSAIRRALVSFAQKNAVDGINDETSSSLTEVMQKLCEKGFLMPLMLCVHAYMKSEVTDVLITLAASANAGSGAGVSSESVQVRGDTLQSYIDQLMSIYVEHKKIIESDCLASQTSSIYSYFTRDDVFSAQQQLEKIMKEITIAYNLRLQAIYDSGTVLVDGTIAQYTTPQAAVCSSFFHVFTMIKEEEDKTKRRTNRLTRCRLILDLLTAAPKDVDQKFIILKADPTFEQYFSDGSPKYARWIADINAGVPRLKNPVLAAGSAADTSGEASGSLEKPAVQRRVWKPWRVVGAVVGVLFAMVLAAGVGVAVGIVVGLPIASLVVIGSLSAAIGLVVGIGGAVQLRYKVPVTPVETSEPVPASATPVGAGHGAIIAGLGSAAAAGSEAGVGEGKDLAASGSDALVPDSLRRDAAPPPIDLFANMPNAGSASGAVPGADTSGLLDADPLARCW